MFFSSQDHVIIQFRSLVLFCFWPVSQGSLLLWLGNELNRMRQYFKPLPSFSLVCSVSNLALLFQLMFVSHQAINSLFNIKIYSKLCLDYVMTLCVYFIYWLSWRLLQVLFRFGNLEFYVKDDYEITISFR